MSIEHRLGGSVDETHKAIGVRFLALILAVGGVLGIGIVLWMAYQFLQQHWVYIFLVAAFMAVFVWTTITGVRLWRGDPRGWKWALILFIAQIPILTVPGFSYEFSVGFAIKVVGRNAALSFPFGLGTSINVYLDTAITDLVYGVNLFALAAAIYLFLKKPSKALQPTAVASGST